MTERVHACPPKDGGGITPCCHRTPFELPATDRITLDAALVTCPGWEPWHGKSGYQNHDCRCDECTAAQAARMRKYRKDRVARNRGGRWLKGRWVPPGE